MKEYLPNLLTIAELPAPQFSIPAVKRALRQKIVDHYDEVVADTTINLDELTEFAAGIGGHDEYITEDFLQWLVDVEFGHIRVKSDTYWYNKDRLTTEEVKSRGHDFAQLLKKSLPALYKKMPWYCWEVIENKYSVNLISWGWSILHMTDFEVRHENRYVYFTAYFPTVHNLKILQECIPNSALRRKRKVAQKVGQTVRGCYIQPFSLAKTNVVFRELINRKYDFLPDPWL